MEHDSTRRKEKRKMSRNELITTIEQLKEWEAILEEAQAEAEALRDSIKAQMLEEDTEELAVGAYIIRWTSVLSNRFDSTAFKREHAELYKSFTKQVASRRFSIA
jgi:predicted phage-related endonuclease